MRDNPTSHSPNHGISTGWMVWNSIFLTAWNTHTFLSLSVSTAGIATVWIPGLRLGIRVGLHQEIHLTVVLSLQKPGPAEPQTCLSYISMASSKKESVLFLNLLLVNHDNSPTWFVFGKLAEDSLKLSLLKTSKRLFRGSVGQEREIVCQNIMHKKICVFQPSEHGSNKPGQHGHDSYHGACNLTIKGF